MKKCLLLLLQILLIYFSFAQAQDDSTLQISYYNSTNDGTFKMLYGHKGQSVKAILFHAEHKILLTNDVKKGLTFILLNKDNLPVDELEVSSSEILSQKWLKGDTIYYQTSLMYPNQLCPKNAYKPTLIKVLVRGDKLEFLSCTSLADQFKREEVSFFTVPDFIIQLTDERKDQLRKRPDKNPDKKGKQAYIGFSVNDRTIIRRHAVEAEIPLVFPFVFTKAGAQLQVLDVLNCDLYLFSQNQENYISTKITLPETMSYDTWLNSQPLLHYDEFTQTTYIVLRNKQKTLLLRLNKAQLELVQDLENRWRIINIQENQIYAVTDEGEKGDQFPVLYVSPVNPR